VLRVPFLSKKEFQSLQEKCSRKLLSLVLMIIYKILNVLFHLCLWRQYSKEDKLDNNAGLTTFLWEKLRIYEGASKRFRTDSITLRSNAKVMAANLTILTHKIEIQLHLAAESSTVCSSRSRRPVRKLLDTSSYSGSERESTGKKYKNWVNWVTNSNNRIWFKHLELLGTAQRFGFRAEIKKLKILAGTK